MHSCRTCLLVLLSYTATEASPSYATNLTLVSTFEGVEEFGIGSGFIVGKFAAPEVFNKN